MSNQTLYPNIITNPQRNANVGVQASSLMGGNLAQTFDLQAMRIIKGRVPLNAATGTNVVINEYDGTPVNFGYGDCIVAATVANGNPTADGSASPYGANQFSAGNIIYALAPAPTLNASGTWDAAANSSYLLTAAASSYTALNAGTQIIATPPNIPTSVVAPNLWLNATSAAFATADASTDLFANITMIVLNPTLAQ
jgi:hypothetical protein